MNLNGYYAEVQTGTDGIRQQCSQWKVRMAVQADRKCVACQRAERSQDDGIDEIRVGTRRQENSKHDKNRHSETHERGTD